VASARSANGPTRTRARAGPSSRTTARSGIAGVSHRRRDARRTAASTLLNAATWTQ
jgi:hypothetical protein